MSGGENEVANAIDRVSGAKTDGERAGAVVGAGAAASLGIFGTGGAATATAAVAGARVGTQTARSGKHFDKGVRNTGKNIGKKMGW